MHVYLLPSPVVAGQTSAVATGALDVYSVHGIAAFVIRHCRAEQEPVEPAEGRHSPPHRSSHFGRLKRVSTCNGSLRALVWLHYEGCRRPGHAGTDCDLQPIA